MTFPAKFPQLNETQLTEHARTVLIRVIRVAFPHARIPDGPYERTADIILKEAQASTWFRVALTQGLNSLDGLAGGDFCATRRRRRLPGAQGDRGHRLLRVRPAHHGAQPLRRPGGLGGLGYEGPSFDKGGYLHRGFNDLDWLPEPRIEEYDGPETFEPIWRAPGGAAGNGASTPDTRFRGSETRATSSRHPVHPAGPPRGRHGRPTRTPRRRASDGRASTRTTIPLSSSSAPAPVAARWRTN